MTYTFRIVFEVVKIIKHLDQIVNRENSRYNLKIFFLVGKTDEYTS